MGRKVDGTKVRVRDPESGRIVWIDRALLRGCSDASDDGEPSHESAAPASTTAHASSPASASTPAVAPLAVAPVAPLDDDDDDDGDEVDDVAAFLGEPQRQRASPSRPTVSAAPSSARASSGSDVFDFWAGAEPHVEELSKDD